MVLLLRLHDNQTANAENVLTSQTHGPPLDLVAHRAAIVVDLGHMAEDLVIYFGAHGFGEVLGKVWVLDLAWEGGFDAEGGLFVELWV